MSLAHQSIATINSPQFINLNQLDINPLMSSCEIKVFYIGKNRNGSYISKQVATEMAKTLRGAPIVGYFKEQKEDFADHGEQIICDDEGIHFNTLTKPYGFVAPDAKVWFQDFEDTDDFGNKIVRTYLMTTGYLWTGQFKQTQAVVEQGRPQSMQLDQKSLKGHWSTDINENMDFFIINDAIFSKLCILGEDVEPCFQGAGITPPEVSSSFTLDENFKKTLFNMMEELKYALKGGNTVADIEKTNEAVVETPEVQNEFTEEVNEVTAEENIEPSFEEAQEENMDATVESTFEEKKQDDKEENPENEEEDKNDPKEDSQDDEEDKDKKKYTLLEEKYNALQSDFESLQNELTELRQFKASIEDKQKDDLISQFYMLSDEDKKDVMENKANYSLDEIKSKLAVICFEKKVNFNLEIEEQIENDSEGEESPVVTFNVESTNNDSTPDWIKAVESTMNNRL